MSNHRRHANVLPIATFITWSLVAVFIACTCMYCVWVRHQRHIIGDEIKAEERRLEELKSQNLSIATKIATLSSTKKLEERVSQGLIALQPIVQVETLRVRGGADDDTVRPVSNRSRGPQP